MGLVKYDIQERDFDRTKSDQYELSILFGVGSFAYIVQEVRSRQILAYRSVELDINRETDFPQQLQAAFQQDDILRPNLIRQVHLSWLYPVHTLVPTRLYDPASARSYLEHLSELGSYLEVRTDAIHDFSLQLVYGLPGERRDLVVRRLAARKEEHLAKGLLSMWRQVDSGPRRRAVFANFRDNHLVLGAIEQERILYFNTFPYREAKDALYFVLLAFQQCSWSPGQTPLYLSGEVLEDSAVYRQLYRFVRHIHYLVPAAPACGPALAQLPAHLYTDLLAIGN